MTSIPFRRDDVSLSCEKNSSDEKDFPARYARVMKLLIPLIITLISLPLHAQESPTPVKPTPESVKQKPPVINPSPSASTKSSSTKSRVSSRRVVLPSKTTQEAKAKAYPTRSGSTGRRVAPIPTSRTTTTGRTGAGAASSGVRSVSRNPVATSRPAPPTGLQENITIQLKGSTQSGDAIDLSLTGIGPIFQSDVFIGEEDNILTHSYSITPSGPNYLVEFSIGTRVRVMTANNGPTKSFQYRDNSISGKVLLKPGKPVTVSNNQGKVLALTVSQP